MLDGSICDWRRCVLVWAPTLARRGFKTRGGKRRLRIHLQCIADLEISKTPELHIGGASSRSNARLRLNNATGAFVAILQRHTGCENAELRVEQSENQRAV